MFTVNELLKATNGRLISGKKEISLSGISIDSRTIKPQEAFVAIKGHNFNGHNFVDEAIKKWAKAIILESARSLKSSGNVSFIEVRDTVKALGDIARFKREKFAIPVIAVTGSNGKTTSKEMIAWVLAEDFKVLKNAGTKNNQIGLPLTLLELDGSYNLCVLEMGTNHPGEIAYLASIARPNVGVITNIGPAHLEFLKDLKGIFREKSALTRNLKHPRLALLNADDDLLKRQIIRKTKGPFILSFGVKRKSDFYASDIKMLNGKIEFRVNKKYRFTLKTPGYYNIYNALAAITVARLFGMEYKDIASRLSNFSFPQSRLEPIELNKIKFINDTYNSNPASLNQALDALDNFRVEGRKIFVMGDMLELGSRKELLHRQAGKRLALACDVFIAVGRLSRFAADAARRSGFDSRNIFTCDTPSQARDILFNRISPKESDLILVKGSRLMQMEEVFK